MAYHQAVKHGVGRLTASAEQRSGKLAKSLTTRLTQVSHKAPTRLLPLHKSSVKNAGAAVCSLSNYGAGMLQGDSATLSIDVEHGATLGVTTQGSNRIYTPNTDQTCKATMNATLHSDSFLVWAPDPCALFASSSFIQRQNVHVHPDSSLVMIDWFSSGRYRNGERWDFNYLSSQTSLNWNDAINSETHNGSDSGVLPSTTIDAASDIPFIADSVLMDYTGLMSHNSADPMGVRKVNTFASMILYGDRADDVIEACQQLQADLAAQYTRTRGIATQPIDLGLSGRVLMGFSKVATDHQDAHVVRFAADTNEDLYRIFHHCLQPLESQFGLQFYKDRIRATRSEIPRKDRRDVPNEVWLPRSRVALKSVAETASQTEGADVEDQSPSTSPSTSSQPQTLSWKAWMLADSGLPTGSFAHSAGIEAAAQLQLLRTEDDVKNFIHAATLSFIQANVPFIMEGYQLIADGTANEDFDAFVQRWLMLQAQVQAVIGCNQVACFASLDQGKSLARVAKQLLESDADGDSGGRHAMFLDVLQGHDSHLAPVFGATGACLEMPEEEVCRLLGFCAARDMISATVRLALIGPLAGVRMLSTIDEAVEDGYRSSQRAIRACDGDPVEAAGASAPVIETIHPCHEILQTRLFRS